MKGIFSVLILASIVAFPATAIEAPAQRCHKIYVTHQKITVTGRAMKDGRILPLEIIDPDEPESTVGVQEITIKLSKKLNTFRLEQLPNGWQYIEVRVTTNRETPPSTIPRGTLCVEIVWRKPELPARRPVDPRPIDGGFRFP